MVPLRLDAGIPEPLDDALALPACLEPAPAMLQLDVSATEHDIFETPEGSLAADGLLQFAAHRIVRERSHKLVEHAI